MQQVQPWIRWQRSPAWMAVLTVGTAGVVGLWWLFVALAEIKDFNRGKGAGPIGCGGWLLVMLLISPLLVIGPVVLLTRDIRHACARVGAPGRFSLLWPALVIVLPLLTMIGIWLQPAARIAQAPTIGGPIVLTLALFVFHGQRVLNELWSTQLGFADAHLAPGVVLPDTPARRRVVADGRPGKYTGAAPPAAETDGNRDPDGRNGT